MRLDTLYIQGFRNYKEATINFNEHSLIIGANDVGKTNLLYSLRILLDRGFSDYDFELKDSDFFAYETTNCITIRAYFSNITEDCIVAHLKGVLSDDGKFVIQYKAAIENGKTEYQFYCGRSDSDSDLKPIDSPFYRKYLNVKYIGSHREFWKFINRSKLDLLQQAKENRNEDVIKQDDTLYEEIQKQLEEIDGKIPQLSYIRDATNQLNDELNKLSIHNKEQKVVFDTLSTDVDKAIMNVSMTARHGDKNLLIGGEGRINQIYLSLWASQNQPKITSTEVSIICIEESEAYLHPHQQRELAAYLGKTLSCQVILSSHSPYIVSEFNPNSIIRLYKGDNNQSKAASNGCSEIIKADFEDFGYRMSVIPAEAFFSDCVVLIEGPSESIFYKTIGAQLNLELDRHNITVLSVDGVGFQTYVNILDSLNIHWIMRTDNDIMKIPKKDEYRYAGIERGLSVFDQIATTTDEDRSTVLSNRGIIHGFGDKNNIPDHVKEAANILISVLKKYCIYIAEIGLEEDLYNGPLKQSLKNFYGEDLSDAEVIEKMKSKKAENLYEFLKKNKEELKLLKGNYIIEPLIEAKSYIENLYGAF